MKVPFQLLRRETAAAADAGLLFASSFEPLADALTRLAGDSIPIVHALHGGFLIVPRERLRQALPGVIRMRRVGGELFVPADADLSPALLSDEIVALTRECGLVFLPDGEVHGYDPKQPLSLDHWLKPANIRAEEWLPFPERPPRAQRLRTIERPPRTIAVLEVLNQGQPDDAEPLPGANEREADGTGSVPEDARPPSASPLKRLAAGTAFGVGRALAWLGRALQLRGLANAGANLARKALEQVPRLSEKLLGEQEAALREVLRQLRSGDIEKGLRRAPIAVGDPDAPARVGTDARLSSRNPRYSLRDLISSGAGGATAWLGGGDVWLELAKEYRRLADDAVRRGDFHRAAYLHGVLLRDLRSAANVLMAGGHFGDAAVIFRDRLNDAASAASAFEKAGDYEEAIRLYERVGRFEQAAELLRTLGDEERAGEFFTRAADMLAAQNRFLAAGDLVRSKIGRRDLAIDFYRQGWNRMIPESVPCAERLLDEHLVAQAWTDVEDLLGQAEILLAPPRSQDAGRFFNYALNLKDVLLPLERRDDLADRARLFFARHLHAKSGVRASDLFAGGVWSGSVVRDAAFAARERTKSLEPGPVQNYGPLKLAEGTVTAVVQARDSFDLVVATTKTVVVWRVGDARVLPVRQAGEFKLVRLATDATADCIYFLCEQGDHVLLRSSAADGGSNYHACGSRWFDDSAEETAKWYMQPAAAKHRDESFVTVVAPRERVFLFGKSLRSESLEAFVPGGANTHLLVAIDKRGGWEWSDRHLTFLPNSPTIRGRCCLPGWTPAIPPDSPLLAKSVDWIVPDMRVLEVTGIDQQGVVYWSRFDSNSLHEPRHRTLAFAHGDRCLASCIISAGRIAAVTRQNEVHWLRVTGKGLDPWALPTKVPLPARVVALAPRPTSNEVLAVFEDGTAARIQRPG